MGKGRHAYIPRKMVSGVQDITCVFVGVMKKTSILQCPGMVCSPPVVSKCLGEAHRRLELFTLFTLHYIITLHYITLNLFFFIHTVGNFFFLKGNRPTVWDKKYLKTA